MGAFARRTSQACFVLVMALIVASAGPAWARSAPAEEWAPRYCLELDQWRSEIAKIVPQVQEIVAATTDANPPSAQRALASVYRNAGDDSRAFVKAMKDVGQPEVKNGKKIAKLVSTTFGGMADAFDTAAADIAKPAAKTKADLTARGGRIETTLQSELDALATSFGKLATLDTSGDLGAQLTTQSVCAPYFGSG